MNESSENALAQVLGQIPSGCSVATARHENRSTGIVVSWVQQAAFEPLLLTVAIKESRPILELINASGRFVLNLLHGDPQPLFKHFSRGFSLAEPAFEGLSTRESEYGVILDDALGYLECVVQTKVGAGDHWVYIARPEAALLLKTCEPYVHIRKSADAY